QKRGAATDQAPGPSRASAAPIVASSIAADGSPGCAIALTIPRTATKAPTIGVHTPAISNAPRIAPNTSKRAVPKEGCVRSVATKWAMRAAAAASRMINRPTPGQPSANEENKRRKANLMQRSAPADADRASKGEGRSPLSGRQDFRFA